jgi:epsilon-lactone hydrolase
MPRSSENRTSGESITIHSLDPDDAAIAAAMRSALSSFKGVPMGVEARGQYDSIMESVLPTSDLKFEPDTVGGVSGLWVHPADPRSGAAILHLHGGWFNFGSATAYRHLVGQIVARVRASAYIPDYRLAPESPFPAATDDVLACYRGLSHQGFRRIALTGDSAGGNLALGLASRIASHTDLAGAILVGVAAFSPVTDLTLSGSTYDTRAEADPLFTRAQVAALVHCYLGDADPASPLASPLYGQFAGMAPIRVHVGDDELLLDDSRRYVRYANDAGVDARLDVWMGMFHGFPGSVGKLRAAGQALDDVGTFLADRMRA